MYEAHEGRKTVVYKPPITREQLEKLFESGQLGNSDSKNSRQLMQTAWFYVMLYFGKRGRENISKLSKKMLVLCSTPQGRRYFELRREALVSTKNPQGGTTTSTKLTERCLEYQIPLVVLLRR